MYVLIITILGKTSVPVVVHSIPGFSTPELAAVAGAEFATSLKDYDLTVKLFVFRQDEEPIGFGSPK